MCVVMCVCVMCVWFVYVCDVCMRAMCASVSVRRVYVCVCVYVYDVRVVCT